MGDMHTDMNTEIEIAQMVPEGDDRDWKLIVLAILAVVMMIITGALIGYTITHAEDKVSANEEEIDANRSALIAVCSSLTTLRFVFEQLEILDKSIARDQTLSAATRASVRSRATLYATAVVGLSDIQECRRIE